MFDDWDDFVDAVDELVEKGIVEKYINDNGEESIKLTETGIKYAQFLRSEEC